MFNIVVRTELVEYFRRVDRGLLQTDHVAHGLSVLLEVDLDGGLLFDVLLRAEFVQLDAVQLCQEGVG